MMRRTPGDDNCDLETNKALVNEVIPVREKAKARHGNCTLTNHDNEYNHSNRLHFNAGLLEGVTRILHYFRNT
jgi:hypothetical protein